MELDRRKETLLGVLVDAYVTRAEPVGSEWLADAGKLGVRSATIRNELAEMTEMGYLRQPHTSAGRIPSDRGYRYYVDHLLEPPLGQAAPAPGLARDFTGIENYSEGDVEQLLLQTCRILSSLTQYTAMAAPPASEEPRIRTLHLAQMSDSTVLMVAVLDNGRVIHRLVELSAPLPPREVSRLSNALDRLLRGASRDATSLPAALPRELAAHEEALRTLLTALRRGLDEHPEEITLQGTSHILEQPEFRDADRVEPLVRLLEERRTAYEKLREMLAERNLTVVIGGENPHVAFQECSVILARYRAGDRMTGWIGILGPTRLHYQRALPAVRSAAQALSEAFSKIGLA